MNQSLKNYTSRVSETLVTADAGLMDLIAAKLDGAARDRAIESLARFETKLPTWEKLATEASRPEKLPRVEKYDRVGNAVEDIILPLETQILRRDVVHEGIFNNASLVEKFAKIYLLAQLGESSVTCPLACTDGLIGTIQAVGSDFLKKEYLPRLLSEEEPLAGAQFVTEQSGGSDVGAIEGTALPQKDGTWTITAEKWFCSAFDEFFLVAARPKGAPTGTDGIGIFFVPRMLDGKPNGYSIRRLKDKLGTQSLPTAEIDFQDSKAWVLGKSEEGFHNLMNHVLNVSRIHNAANTLGFHRRAYAEALNYAQQRGAFGKKLIEFPLIQDYLLHILASLYSRRSLFFDMVTLVEEGGLRSKNKEERLWTRCLINLLKYRTAQDITENIKRAIMVFGANGIVQDFSILPRLLRDALICETWEGPHNTLCLQIMRDAGRFEFWARFQKEIVEVEAVWPSNLMPNSRVLFLEAVANLAGLVRTGKVVALAVSQARRLVDWVGALLEVGSLVKSAQELDHHRNYVLAAHVLHTTFATALEQFENPVLKGMEKWGMDLLNEEALKVDLKGL